MDSTDTHTYTETSRGFGTGGVLLRTLVVMALCTGLDGCVVVGGSSRGGFFIWPGGLGLLVMVVLLVVLLRRR